MEEAPSQVIDIDRLQPGMYIELELGWMAHPFPTGSFKITSERQIEIIRGLGRKQVRYVPAKSDPPPNQAVAPTQPVADEQAALVNDNTPAQRAAREQLQRKQRAEALSAQQRDLAMCERRFGQTVRQYKQALEQVHSKPQEVMTQCQTLVNGYVGEMLGASETAIRLLSDGMGDKVALHPVNISIISLLLGKQLGLDAPDMGDLGLAAFLHDIGKSELPERVRWLDDSFSAHELKAYQTHVAQGVMLGQRMGLPPGALLAIAQHHEMVDGSGFPARLKGDAMSLPAKILALVNRYENLCNPSRPSAAVTPHEALALIFAQFKSRFDATVLGGFIRMMGVYPPGSVVQLADERYAMVVSVNSSRPLKPRIIVFDTRVPKHEALILDLEAAPELSIKRSLKPASLPRAAMDYLSPRQRICYFFERSMDAPLPEVAP
ncbi:MAG: phosphohydrolase [Rhodoferax ferrireducens]|uniref:Phosphohydrolase n=1 Tax=Rhodoferax ferrireducens TaxID=192843 RepID=A0A1W9KRC0_9BURK|nr:MAG: phosphohydrolase [Rhodoferax ferrireducens]